MIKKITLSNGIANFYDLEGGIYHYLAEYQDTLLTDIFSVNNTAKALVRLEFIEE